MVLVRPELVWGLLVQRRTRSSSAADFCVATHPPPGGRRAAAFQRVNSSFQTLRGSLGGVQTSKGIRVAEGDGGMRRTDNLAPPTRRVADKSEI